MNAVMAAWVAIGAAGFPVLMVNMIAFERWVVIGARLCALVWVVLVVVFVIALRSRGVDIFAKVV